MIRELLLLSLGLNVLAFLELEPENADKRSVQILCGEALSKELSRICNGQFFSPLKKSYPYTKSGISDLESVVDRPFPFKPMSDALSALKYRRIKRGVHNECCLKACSISEMQSYCAY